MATSLRQSWVREETEERTSGVLQGGVRWFGKGSPSIEKLSECVGAATENIVVR